MQLLEHVRHFIFQNRELSWVIVVLSALLLTVTLKIILHFVSKIFRRIARHVKSHWLEISCDIIDDLSAIVVFGSFIYWFSEALPVARGPKRILFITFMTLVIFQTCRWGIDIIKHFKNAVLKRRIAKDPSAATAIGLVYTSAQIAFVILVILIGLSNIGINIGALLTGLGVGGLAVALAAQNILSDLLASLSIVIDKPFVVGDFIIVDDALGVVEYIGLKTTRIRSLSGEQLVFSNKDLLESRIRNCQNMWERRVSHRLTVVNATKPDVLENIPRWVQAAIGKHEKLRFERCSFVQYNQSHPEFEFVFWVLDADYMIFVDLQQKLLLDIHRKLMEEKVRLAYPSQSLYVETVPENRRESFVSSREAFS